MKIEMCKLNKIDIDINKIKTMKFKNGKNENGKFILKTMEESYMVDVNNAFDYFHLYDFLRKICPDKSYKDWLSEFIIKDVDKDVKCVMRAIKIDRIAKKMNEEIIHNTIFKILLDDYKDFGYNAMKIGDFDDNVKKAILIFKNRKAVYA